MHPHMLHTRLSLVITALLCAVLLIIFPTALEPFHEPKRWLFATAVLLAALITFPRWKWTAFPLVVVATLHPTLELVAFAWALATFPALKVSAKTLINALAWTGFAIACVVLLQRAGLDVFSIFGPRELTPRLSLYGTLGNPDFVASVLLPIAVVSLRGPWWRTLIMCSALALTGSLAVVSCAIVAAVSFGLAPLPEPLPRWGRGRAGLLLLLITPLFTRDVGLALRGRAYLVKVAAPHVTLLGGAPVVDRWPQWELDWWQARCADAACVTAHPDGRFTGLQDHVHADWLELLLVHGVFGLAAFLLALAGPLRAAWNKDPLLLAALTAALARGLVDFPLERPADLCLLAALCCLPFLPEPPCTAPSSSS
jgi:putative inorganic carbon (hco3(-)) transporter